MVSGLSHEYPVHNTMLAGYEASAPTSNGFCLTPWEKELALVWRLILMPSLFPFDLSIHLSIYHFTLRKCRACHGICT